MSHPQAPYTAAPDPAADYQPATPEALTLGHLEHLVAAGQGCSSESLRGFYDLLKRRETGYTLAERTPEDGADVWFVIDATGRPWMEYYHGRILGGRYCADRHNGFGIPGTAYGHCVSRWGYLPTIPVIPMKPAEDTCPSCGAPTGGPGWHCDACAEMGNHLPGA